MSQTTERAHLQRRALRLEYATIVWNVGEAVLTIGLGIAAGSLALIGFGTDSIIELFASLVVVWHIAPRHEVDRPERTGRALRLVALAFFALATVLVLVAVRDLASGRRPGESLFGVVYLAITAVVMLGLAVAKRRTADLLDSAPLRSEAAVTLLDAALAAATMLGLALNAWVGWWWADAAAALVVGFAAANEGREAWNEANEESPQSR